jgi:outer membrane protein assembly factor BamA
MPTATCPSAAAETQPSATASQSYGATLQVGTPITEQLGVMWRYSIYNQAVTLDPETLTAVPSLPVAQAAAAGPASVSPVGDTIAYNTLDNNKAPTSRINSQLKQDLAGLGGDVNFLKTTEDFRRNTESRRRASSMREVFGATAGRRLSRARRRRSSWQTPIRCDRRWAWAWPGLRRSAPSPSTTRCR